MNRRFHSSLVLSALLGACAETDLKPPEQGTASDGATESAGASSGPAECPGVADPECTTSAACGNGEICVSCECVPEPDECSDPGAANCLDDSNCGDGEECLDCVCVPKCLPEDPNECFVDADCDAGAACVQNAIDLCVCEGGGGSTDTTGSPPLDGESDPVDDCTNDEGPAACVPSMDLELIGLDCAGADAEVRIQVASGMVNDMPADYDTIQVFFQPTDGSETHWVRGFGQGGAYDCDYRIGATYMPLGAGDVCEINLADGTFDITLTAATSGATFEAVTVESTLSSPYLYDGAGPFDFTCP